MTPWLVFRLRSCLLIQRHGVPVPGYLSGDPEPLVSCQASAGATCYTGPRATLCPTLPVISTRGVRQEVEEKPPLQLDLHQVWDLYTADANHRVPANG